MLANKNCFTGIVVALKANYFIVEINCLSENINYSFKLDKKNGSIIRLLCTKRNRLSYHGSFVSVGDIVTVESVDWNESRGVITGIKPRYSFLERPSIANFTDVIVMVSFEKPSFDLTQVSRFLIKAEESTQNVILIMNKSDLIDNDILDKYHYRMNQWGYEVIPISIFTGDGISTLIKKLDSIKLGFLCGPSGVGKTSLLNYLIPRISLPIGSLSKKLQRGRHTTRHVELFSLESGGFLADTPGFNKPEFTIKPQHLAELFPELRSQLVDKKCKFRNCLHLDEPGCAISRNWERYENYKNCLMELSNQRR